MSDQRQTGFMKWRPGLVPVLVAAGLGVAVAWQVFSSGKLIVEDRASFVDLNDADICETVSRYANLWGGNYDAKDCKVTDARGAYLESRSKQPEDSVTASGGLDYMEIVWERLHQTEMGRSVLKAPSLSDSEMDAMLRRVAEQLPVHEDQRSEFRIREVVHPNGIRSRKLSFDYTISGFAVLDRPAKGGVEIREDGLPLRISLCRRMPATVLEPRITEEQAVSIMRGMAARPDVTETYLLGAYQTEDRVLSLGYYFPRQSMAHSAPNSGGGVLVDAMTGAPSVIAVAGWPYQIARRNALSGK